MEILERGERVLISLRAWVDSLSIHCMLMPLCEPAQIQSEKVRLFSAEALRRTADRGWVGFLLTRVQREYTFHSTAAFRTLHTAMLGLSARSFAASVR